MTHTMVLVANHGSLGGGEIMLLRCAHALRELGVTPVVVAPRVPLGVADAARAASLNTVTYVPERGGPAGKLCALRRAVARVRGQHSGALTWCHGLGPAVATVGMARRVVHLHRVPDARQWAPLLTVCAGALDVLVPSRDTLSRLPPTLRQRTHVLANWSDDVAFHPPAFLGGAASVRVGFLGRPAPGKGVAELVSAMQRLRVAAPELDPVLRVAGTPLFVTRAQQQDVDRSLACLGEHVQQVGWMDRDSFLADTHVLVCPSRWPESFGLVAAEAMAAGVPVVVSDAGALPEVVGDRHPYVAAAGNSADLARVLLAACRDLDTPSGDRVVRDARARWEQWWSPQAGRTRLAEALGRWGVTP